MNNDDKLLEIVSNDVKNSIEQLPIVTPSIYASVFTELAKKTILKLKMRRAYRRIYLISNVLN